MNSYDAVRCGKEILLFNKDTKELIGKSIGALSTGGVVSVEVQQGKIFDEMSKEPTLLLKNSLIGSLKYTYLRFFETTGEFHSMGFGDTTEDVVDKFSNTVAVNEFDFWYGMCPDSFKDFPDYRMLCKN